MSLIVRDMDAADVQGWVPGSCRAQVYASIADLRELDRVSLISFLICASPFGGGAR